MPKAYVLYNPFAGDGKVEDDLNVLEIVIDDEIVFADLTEPGILMRVMKKLEKDDYIILCGGDGTLNCFANDIENLDIPNKILYFPCGTENNFAAEFYPNYGGDPFEITRYLKNLPIVTVKGKTYRFLNGVGFGIHGSYRRNSCLYDFPGKRSAIPMIEMQRLLSKYKPTGATIFVNGMKHRFEKVWIAPTMYGRYYSGGMIPAPQQKRENDQLSLMVFHCSSKFRTLMMLPSMFKGTITKHCNNVSIYSSRKITVTFDDPRPLRIDGETISDVVSYTAAL